MSILKHLSLPLTVFFSALWPLLLPTGQNLEYEYSIIASYSVYVLFPLLKIFVPHRPLIGLHHLLVTASAILISYIPGAILFLLEVCKCSDKGWLFWHSFHLIPAILIVTCLGDITVFFRKKFGRSLSLLFFAFFIISQLILILDSTYLSGMGKAHGIFIGFLHGPIYDNLIITDNGTLRTQYFYTLIAIAAFIGTFEVRSTTPKLKQRYSVLVSIFAIGSILFLIGNDDYRSSARSPEDIKRFLPNSIKINGGTIHYRQNQISKGLLSSITSEATFHIEDLTKKLALKSQPHIEIFLYSDKESKKLLFGGYNTDITDVRTPAIHIKAENFPHSTMRHELVHALLSPIAPLGFHLNMAITEGLAVALDSSYRPFSLDQASGYLLSEGKIKDPRKLFSPLFWMESGARSYTIAGSLLSFIIKNHGLNKVKKLYSGSSWNSVFKENSDQVIESWKSHISKAYDKKTHKLYTSRFYRSKGVLFNICPHTKASLRFDRNNLDFFHPSNYSADTNLTKYLVQRYPENKTYILNHLKNDQSQTKNKERALSEFIKNPPESIEDIKALILLADEYVEKSEFKKASKTLNELEDIRTKKFLGNYLNSEISIRQELIKRKRTDDIFWYLVLAKKQKAETAPTKDAPWEYIYIYTTTSKVKPKTEFLNSFDVPTNLDARFIWLDLVITQAIANNEIDIASGLIDQLILLSSESQKEHYKMIKNFVEFIKNGL